MLGPSSHHQRATLTATILGMQLAAVTTIGIATSTDAHADSDLGPPALRTPRRSTAAAPGSESPSTPAENSPGRTPHPPGA